MMTLTADFVAEVRRAVKAESRAGSPEATPVALVECGDDTGVNHVDASLLRNIHVVESGRSYGLLSLGKAAWLLDDIDSPTQWTRPVSVIRGATSVREEPQTTQMELAAVA